MLDVRAIRDQFPITHRRLHVLGTRVPRPLIYLDNAASTHPPSLVLDAHRTLLEHSYANTHRGKHRLSRAITRQFERVRKDICRFISASSDASTTILVGNTTQALDLAAHVLANVEGVTLVSLMEHHSNDLPHRARARVAHFGVLADGTLDYDELERKLSQEQVKLVAVTGASNVTGYLPDIHRIARIAHAHGARILVDAAQLLAHVRIDVRPEGDPGHLDFLAAAGHKAYAPFGSAFLHAPRGLCDAAPPYLPGGGTVAWVTKDDVHYKESPERHEGGTPSIAGAIALGASLRFLEEVGLDAIREHERALTMQLLEGLRALEHVKVLGHLDAGRRIGVVSFTVEGLPHEIAASVLDREAAIAVRNGCFCAHPYVHQLLGLEDTSEFQRRLEAGEETALPGAIRASVGIYNTEQEVDTLLKMVRSLRGRGTLEGLTQFETRSSIKRS